MAQEATQVITLDPSQALQELREKQRRIERLTLFIVGGIFSVILLLVLLPFGIFEDAGKVIQRYEHGGEVVRNPAKACLDPRNRNMAFCQDREGPTDSNWRDMSRYQSGKVNQFTLHGKQ